MTPAPRQRRYSGQRNPREGGPASVWRVDGDGARKALPPRHDLRNHSPDGFQWGYAGSGPAQLALALLADATGDDELAQRHYQAFKFSCVAGLPPAWEMTAGEIADFVTNEEALCRG